MSHAAVVMAIARHATTGGHSSTTAQSVSASSLLVQMVIGLVVIIALIKVASRLVQGRGGRALSATRRRGSVTVVGRQSLGKGVQVAMVSAGEATYLLGVTQRQVTLLGQLDPEVDPASAAIPDVAVGELQLLHGDSELSSPEASRPMWKSPIEQMRAKTLRRA
jgi:flagellar biogenesis protein FliO